MEIRYNLDPESGVRIFTIMGSGNTRSRILQRKGEDYPARRDARVKLGQTAAGRYLQVVYVPDEVGEGIFVITAFEMTEKRKKAYRRRQRRKSS